VSQPSVVFIDDSATMREVIKIAFRRENFEVFAFADPNAALDHIEEQPPDVLITDVIMPDHDGFQVCEYIKQHPKLSATPVILMSGVVNRDVAERAFAVKAAELVRKPFQPQDLITRVKQLLHPASAQAVTPEAAATALSNIFAAPQPVAPLTKPVNTTPQPVSALRTMPQRNAQPSAAPESSRLNVEVLRLEGLVRKLQAELAAEREYTTALEEHIKTLQESRFNSVM
jgi:CheY-like chemotaxis protein